MLLNRSTNFCFWLLLFSTMPRFGLRSFLLCLSYLSLCLLYWADFCEWNTFIPLRKRVFTLCWLGYIKTVVNGQYIQIVISWIRINFKKRKICSITNMRNTRWALITYAYECFWDSLHVFELWTWKYPRWPMQRCLLRIENKFRPTKTNTPDIRHKPNAYCDQHGCELQPVSKLNCVHRCFNYTYPHTKSGL